MFPQNLAHNQKLHKNFEFKKSVGRDDGMSFQKRKISRLSADILYKEESKEKKRLVKLHEEAGKQVMENLRRNYNLISDKPLL